MRPWLLIALLAFTACAKAPREDETAAGHERKLTVDLTSPPYRQQALRWVTGVRQAHLEAERLEKAGDVAAALALLNGTLEHQAPMGVPAWHESTMRRDLYGHAARLALILKRNEEANRFVEAGLAIEDSADDPFHTQLLFLAVEVAQARNDPEGEARARRELHAALRPATE